MKNENEVSEEDVLRQQFQQWMSLRPTRPRRVRPRRRTPVDTREHVVVHAFVALIWLFVLLLLASVTMSGSMMVFWTLVFLCGYLASWKTVFQSWFDYLYTRDMSESGWSEYLEHMRSWYNGGRAMFGPLVDTHPRIRSALDEAGTELEIETIELSA